VNELDREEYAVNQKLSGSHESRKSLENQVKSNRNEVNQRHAAFQAASLALEQVRQKQDWQKGQLTTLNDQVGKVSKEMDDLQKKLDATIP